MIISAVQVEADTIIDTTSLWNGTSGISIGAFATGQTFTVPENNNILDSFSFYIGYDNGRFSAFIMEWAVDRTIGPILYQSDIQTAVYCNMENRFDFFTGGINLEIDKEHVMFFTPGNFLVGIISDDPVNGPLGFPNGQLFASSASSFDELSTEPWDTCRNGYEMDFAFTANFSAPAPVPEPATMLLLGSGLVGLAGLRRKFRKR